MLQHINLISTARIEVKQKFCKNCSASVKTELQKIEDVNHIRLYPKESLITFNFKRANKLSEALNALSNIGFQEKEESILNIKCNTSICPCF